MTIRLPLDIKSLYLNIKNDNESGHTATVATPLKQYGAVHEELMPIFDIPDNINVISKEDLITSILSKSRAEARIVKVCVFDKISVNGILLNGVSSFCIYVREETAPTNVHCGRQKIHYPTTLKFSDSEVEINNKQVMKAISEALNDYAFIVEAFEYDTNTGTLNFDAIIVGENEIPYSKVFINKRGVGSKYSRIFNEDADSYDMEIIALREHLGYATVTADNYAEIVATHKSTARNLVEEILVSQGAKNIKRLYDEYPYSIYDLEYTIQGRKQYVIVNQTATKKIYFNLSSKKIEFLNFFENESFLYLVTDIVGNADIKVFTPSDLYEMNKSIQSVMYYQSTED